MMSKIILLILTTVLCHSGVNANQCPSRSLVPLFCPGITTAIFESSSPKSYCCLDSEDNYYCCDAQDYALNTGLKIIYPAIIGVVIVVVLFVFFITCLCCSCCPWYKRRHRGTVYGKVHTPGVIIQQVAAPVPNQPTQMPHQPYVVHAEPSMQYPSQPPPYTVEPYAQQAPYNPNFPQ